MELLAAIQESRELELFSKLPKVKKSGDSDGISVKEPTTLLNTRLSYLDSSMLRSSVPTISRFSPIPTSLFVNSWVSIA